MLNWPLYTRSIQLPRAENASIKWSVQVMLDWPLYTSSIPLPPIKWPVQVKIEKNNSRCWTGHFIPAPSPSSGQKKKNCIKWPVQVKPLKKLQSMLDWQLYTRSIPLSRAENPCIKWSVQVKPLKKRQSMLDRPLYTSSRSPLKKRQSMSDWQLYREGGWASGECLNIIEYSEAKTDRRTQLYSTDLLSETVQVHTNRDNNTI